MRAAVSAHTTETDTDKAVESLQRQLAQAEPAVLFFFASPNHDGRKLCQALSARYSGAQVLGCSTCGEFTDSGRSKGGVAVLALDRKAVPRCVAELASFSDGVEAGIRSAALRMSKKLGHDLRELDPTRNVGVVLFEGSKMKEEAANEALGNAAPLLSFVGGSAGDNIQFKQTWVHCNGQTTEDGAALVAMELAVPFRVLKTCNYQEGPTEFLITKADANGRTIYELNHQPAAEAYAKAVGTTPDKLDFGVFLHNPLGLMVDGQPWLRSIIKATDGGGLFFACQIKEGMRVKLMRGKDLVAETKTALDQTRKELGGSTSGALLFNCAYRLLEMEAHKQEDAYHGLLSGFPLAGFHTHGESWLGHINQTLTGLVLG